MVRSIDAEVTRDARGVLRLRYRIEADLARLRIPPPRPPAPGERLWEHTCCELFVAQAGAAAYHEFNFSPSGAWAAYAFSDYRAGGPSPCPDPGISVTRNGNRLELAAAVAALEGPLLVGLTAVVEAQDGQRSYWALRHPPGKPDFHHRDAFALELA